MSKITIVCPVYNEKKYISACLDSILNQDFCKKNMEVLFIDGMSTDGTREVINDYILKYSFIFLLDNPDKTVPYALNIGINAAKGDIIIRLDGHCVYPSNYVPVLAKYLNDLNAENVGAVWNTLPAKNTALCKAIAIGVSHKFGIGNSLHKVGVKKVTETDTVPFGCFPRNIFDRIGFFDNDLIRNQDDEFNGRIIKNGGKIYLIPDLVIDYYARESISKMSKMFYQYGLFKPLVNKKLGSPATIRQFFPVLFLIGLVLGAITGLFSGVFAWLYIIILSFYFALSFSFSLKESLQSGEWRLSVILPVVFFVIHISYGWGYLEGIYKILMKRSFNVNINR